MVVILTTKRSYSIISQTWLTFNLVNFVCRFSIYFIDEENHIFDETFSLETLTNFVGISTSLTSFTSYRIDVSRRLRKIPTFDKTLLLVNITNSVELSTSFAHSCYIISMKKTPTFDETFPLVNFQT